MSRSSLETAEFRRGPGGRPTRAEAERRHRALLDAAKRLFLEKGLDGVSVDAIAREAGVAKRFIYARYADKGELFIAAIEGLRDEQILSLQNFEVPDEPIEKGLFKFGRQLIEIAVKPEHLALYRTLMTEAPRFPSLRGLNTEQNRAYGVGLILRVLETYAARGEIELKDPPMLAELFAILVAVSERDRALVFGRDSLDIENRRLRAAIDLFLNGCRVTGRPSAGGEGRRR
jgi:AcrR family transcriptional regulator